MRVLFDAFWWERGPGANRTVQREFIHAWADAFPSDELVLALRRGAAVEDVPAAEIAHSRLWPHAVANRFDLPRLAREHSVDVTVAHNYSPRTTPAIVFIHDVMFEDHPEWFSAAERLYFSPMLRWARKAGAVTASTQVEARRIQRLSDDRLTARAIGLGVPSALTRATPVRPDAVAEGIEFALSVGRLNVRKNLSSVIRGAARSTVITPTSPLFIVGGTAHSGVGANIPDDARTAIEDGRVIFLGALPDEQVAWLYAHARLTVSLSLDEGFGMPALEAAWFGSPLLVSDIPVYRETVGSCAALVPPLAGPESIAAAIERAWGVAPDDRAREELKARYTWTRAVREMRDVASAM